MPNATVVGDPLTDRQMAVFRFIYEHARDKGYQPSFRQIAAEFGFASYSNSMTCHLVALAKKGFVTGDLHGKSRSIKFLRRPDGKPFTGFADKR